MKVATVLSLGLALIPEMVVAGGFFQSCGADWTIEQGHYMVAKCRNDKNEYPLTRQDLNLCITNRGGQLAPANNGGFGASCYDCTSVRPNNPLVPVGHYTSQLACRCKTGGGGIDNVAVLDLNTFIENRNGYLYCFGHYSAHY